MLLDRRGFVAGSLAAAALVRMASGRAAGRPLTPPNPLGPQYRPGALLKETLVEKGDLGLTVRVTGLLPDPSGTPLDGARLEVFHADPRGDYDLRGHRYRARVPVAADGRYQLETVMPGPPGTAFH